MDIHKLLRTSYSPYRQKDNHIHTRSNIIDSQLKLPKPYQPSKKVQRKSAFFQTTNQSKIIRNKIKDFLHNVKNNSFQLTQKYKPQKLNVKAEKYDDMKKYSHIRKVLQKSNTSRMQMRKSQQRKQLSQELPKRSIKMNQDVYFRACSDWNSLLNDKNEELLNKEIKNFKNNHRAKYINLKWQRFTPEIRNEPTELERETFFVNNFYRTRARKSQPQSKNQKYQSKEIEKEIIPNPKINIHQEQSYSMKPWEKNAELDNQYDYFF